MAKKFMIKKKIIIPILVGLMCCPTLTAFASTTTLDTLMSSNSEIILYETQEVNGATSKSINEQLANLQLDTNDLDTSMTLATTRESTNTQVPSLTVASTTRTETTNTAPKSSNSNTAPLMNNFTEMSKELLDLTGTVQRGSTYYGPLYNVLSRDSFDTVGGNHKLHIEHRDSPTYIAAVGNGEVLPIFDANRDKLAEMSAKSFKDIDPKAYYSSYIPASVFYGIVEGVGDNNYAPKQELSREAWYVIFAKVTQGKESLSKDHTKSIAYQDAVDKGISSWAADAYVVSGSYVFSLDMFKDNAPFSKAALRIETVDSMCKYLYSTELANKYTELAKKGVSVSPFKDIKNVVSKDEIVRLANENGTSFDEERLKVLLKNDGSIDEESYRSLLCGFDKGLIKGMGDGTTEHPGGTSGFASKLERGMAVVFAENFARAAHADKLENNK